MQNQMHHHEGNAKTTELTASICLPEVGDCAYITTGVPKKMKYIQKYFEKTELWSSSRDATTRGCILHGTELCPFWVHV